jgi:hypothetical protein
MRPDDHLLLLDVGTAVIVGAGLGNNHRGKKEGGGKKSCKNLFHVGFLMLGT